MTDLRLAFEQIFGPQDWTPAPWDGAPTYDDPDLYVSDNEARHRQQQVDNWLERESA
jgi:hypothetical protein